MDESSDTKLFIEAAEAELFDLYRTYLASNNVQEWRVLKIFQYTIEKYYSDDYKVAVGYFKNSFNKFLAGYRSADQRLQNAIKRMTNCVDAVLESKLAKAVFERRKTRELKLLYNEHALSSVYQDKTALVDSTKVSSNAGPSTSQQSRQPQSQPVNKKRGSPKRTARSRKKTKRLQVKDIRGLPLNQKVHALIDAFGSSNILNLTDPGLVPARFQYEILKLARKYKFALPLTANETEREFLIQCSNSKSLEDIDSLIKSIPPSPQSGSFTFFSVALTKLIVLWQSEVLLNHEHKETWYQMQVYSDLLDSAFLFDKNYTIKRSECHASSIKYLKQMKKIGKHEKDVKVDLILFNYGFGDIFTCEDKPESGSTGVVQDDIKKGNALREKRLMYLQSIVPYKSNLEHIEIVGAQFHRLTLTIYGSQITTAGDIIHYQKSRATIPASPIGYFPQAAHYLLTVLSLQRNISKNLKKLEIMFEACLKDSVEYLASPTSVNNNIFFFREDSLGTEDSYQSSSVDNFEQEQERRIIEVIDREIRKLDNEEDILTTNDWENFIPQ